MNTKRSMIRVFIHILYAGGSIFLVAGLLLSAVSTTKASAMSRSQSTESSPTTAVTNVGETSSPSSLIFASGCNCSCVEVRAPVCNVGPGNMTAAVPWELYYSPNGNPSGGTVVESGSLGPLQSGECTTLNYEPSEVGYFAYRLQQEPNALGPDVLWSNACMVYGYCFTPSPSATVGLTHTTMPTGVGSSATTTPTTSGNMITLTPGTSTPGPGTATPGTTTQTPPAYQLTLTPTSTPRTMDYNLSAICGYVGDDHLLWKVANHTAAPVDYTWRVSGSIEHGNGRAPANGDDYFTTSIGAKTVRLFVGGQLIDSESDVPACKQAMTLSYVCTQNGLDWYAENPNDVGVDYTWRLENGQRGTGILPAHSRQFLTSTSNGAHQLALTWGDSRPDTHTVTLASTIDSCTAQPVETATTTPGVTATAPQTQLTLTPSGTPVPATLTPSVAPSNTQQAATATSPVQFMTLTPTLTTVASAQATRTWTPAAGVITLTATWTATPVPLTATNTATDTRTVTVAAPTNTATDTATVTLQPSATSTALQAFQLTVTPSSTVQSLQTFPAGTATVESTQINTLPPPASTVTRTPALIPITGADLTGTVGAGSLSLFGGLFTNTGLVMLGLALALTGIRSQWKE